MVNLNPFSVVSSSNLKETTGVKFKKFNDFTSNVVIGELHHICYVETTYEE